MDIVTVIATIVLALVGALTFLVTWRMAAATVVQAEATTGMLSEVQRDRELRSRPYLILDEVEPTTRQFKVTNTGSGPALQCLAILYDPIEREDKWFETEVFQLSPGGSELQTMHAITHSHIQNQRRAMLEGLEAWEMGTQIQYMVGCTDIFGKGHRFLPERPTPEILESGTSQWISWFPNERKIDGLLEGSSKRKPTR